MYSIVYVSTADPALEEEVIKAIFEDFRITNDALGICGILMYSEGNFFQVLEITNTKKKIVIDLFEKIKNDIRHYDIIKIVEKKSPSLSFFTKYTCGFKTLIKPGDISELYKFLKQEKKINPIGYEKISYLAQKFLTLI